jgi:hypothetical protein
MSAEPPGRIEPDAIRTPHPSSWPQYPYNAAPPTPEQSQPRYQIGSDFSVRIRMRDGVELAVDVFRPVAPGVKFPALVAASPYQRQLQRTDVSVAQNEAGITEFWVPRGYVHVVVDVRGSNDSQGVFDLSGKVEQQDLVEVVQWVLDQPWCNGRVGMVGCSYFGRVQLLAAANQCPGLTAIFPYDAGNDHYRETYFHGGIHSSGYVRIWFGSVLPYNTWSGRPEHPEGIGKHLGRIMRGERDLQDDYYVERSSAHRLHEIRIPTYMGSDWNNFGLHLRGAYNAYEHIASEHKKLLIGPPPQPKRPFAVYHLEALRWYDHWLKDLDTRVLEGPPVNLYIQGENRWRGESAWPLPQTDWQHWHLTADGGLARDAGRASMRSYTCAQPAWGEAPPRLAYRSEPLQQDVEVTGPIALHLTAHSSAADTDWFVQLQDEAPDGSTRLLTKGWLRASHREVDPQRSRPFQPWHPHLRTEPLVPGEPAQFEIEVIATSNLFARGHRIRLEIASSEQPAMSGTHTGLLNGATNTVHEGAASWIVLPVIPR